MSGADTGELSEGQGEAAGFRDDQEHPVAGTQPRACRVEHHEDACRSCVAGRMQVREPALVAGFVACLTQPGEEFRAEMLGAVMTEHMLGARVDAARLHQRAELGDAQVDECRER